MNRLLVLIPLLFSDSAVAYQPPAPAARPATQRQIEFEISAEEAPMTLFEADPKLLERRFIAEVKLQVPNHSDLISTASIRGDLSVYESVLESRGRDISYLLSKIRQAQLPASEDLSTLAAEARFVRILAVRDDSPGGGSRRQDQLVSYGVLATTHERAKELTQALLAMLDHVVTEPIQRELRARKEALEAELAEARQRLPVIQKERDALQEQLKNAESLDAPAINDLKTQRRLLEVDLAGVKARIEACEAILNRGGLTGARKDQVENVKITAEIELAGLAARQKTLDWIIDQGQKGLTLNAKAQQVAGLERKIRQDENYVEQGTRRIERYGPFRLVDEKVVIRPIKWEKTP